MKNFQDIVLTKMDFIQDVKNVIMHWKKNGAKKILKKNEKLGQDIGIKIDQKLKIWINCFIKKIEQNDVNIKKNMSMKIQKKAGVINSIEKLFRQTKLQKQNFVKFVAKKKIDLMGTMLIIQGLWTLFGSVKAVISTYINNYHAKRLSVKTPNGEATVRTQEETLRGESEAVFPPLYIMVSRWLLPLKVTALQCITNDLWVNNLRSTGLQAI